MRDLGASNNGATAGCLSDCTDNVCGDGNVWDGTEGCDDGATSSGDGSATCSNESGWHCSGAPSTCVAPNAAMALRPVTKSVTMVIKITAMVVLRRAASNTDGHAPARHPLPVARPVATVSWLAQRAVMMVITAMVMVDLLALLLKTPGWTCSTTPGQATICVTTCGDGVKAGNEVRDIHLNVPPPAAGQAAACPRTEIKCNSDCSSLDTIEYTDGCCGNGTLEAGETCDGSDFGSATRDSMTGVTHRSSSLTCDGSYDIGKQLRG